MGQLVLLVVAAAWAAVLLPPLLRSRVENRPNSSVSDFREQLSRLQRAVPTRGVTVRTMGRGLAPSSRSRPIAGRAGVANGVTNGVKSHGAVSSRIASQAPVGRPSRADARMQEATLRPRQHGEATAAHRRSVTTAGNPSAELKRRRANVLFVLVLTAVCAGFLAATTDSNAMVYLFALAILALGGYVYLLVTLNQREVARHRRDDFYEPAPSPQRSAPPRAVANRGYQGFDDLDEYSDYDPPVRRPASRQPRPAAQPSVRRVPQEMPGSGVSGRISYGVGPAARQPVLRDPYGRDGVGWETAGRDVARRAPVRNGRHATGQHQAVRNREPQPARPNWYSQAG